MNKTTVYWVAAISVPLTCFLIAGGLSANESIKFHRVDQKMAELSKENSAARQLIFEIETRGSTGIVTATPDSRREQVDFVNSLRGMADASHVQITQWGVGTVAPIAMPDTMPPESKALMSSVSPLCNQISILGAYSNVRSFFLALLKQDRFISISGVKWMRAPLAPDTSVTFALTRYVTSQK